MSASESASYSCYYNYQQIVFVFNKIIILLLDNVRLLNKNNNKKRI